MPPANHSLPPVQPHARRARQGLSLVELLVTMAIIGILATLGFGLIGKVRETSDISLNAANLRALGLASMNYAASNGGRLPATTQTVDGEEKTRMTTTHNAPAAAGPRKLLPKDFPGGTGEERYVDSADVFYGPFTPRLNERRNKGQFFSSRGPNDQNGPFTLGYTFYSLPSEPDGSTPPRNPLRNNIATDRLNGEAHPRSPLYTDLRTVDDIVSETGFNSSKFMVVHLDGSVSIFEMSEIKVEEGITAIIYQVSGLRR